MHSKELWFKVRFLSHKLKGNPVVSDEGVVCVSIPSQTNTVQLRNQVYRQLNLDQIVDEEKVVFKLRDFNGALVPLSHQLESNAKDCPFVLEVVDIHQHIQAVDWQIPVLHRENISNRINVLSGRVESLELKMDNLPEDYASKLANELQLLSNQTAVLKRLVTENKEN